MNQKSLRYFLLGGVILIWGAIIYRVIKGLSPEDYVLPVKQRITLINYNAPKDSFILFANYPDPFIPHSDIIEIDKAENDQNQTPQKTTQIKPDPIPTTPGLDINAIMYHGMIANPETKKKIAVITINGKEYLAKDKSRIENIRIQKIEKDQIEIISNGITYTLARKGQ